MCWLRRVFWRKARGVSGSGSPSAAHIPHLGLQGIDAVLAAHQVDEASAQVGTEINELMLPGPSRWRTFPASRMLHSRSFRR